jgi:hypothetical protein
MKLRPALTNVVKLTFRGARPVPQTVNGPYLRLYFFM